eukprot:Transcript_20484.p1 GENE.Transcript_20484~~Transcript_20484.p1  ORF type:complete len:428 (-),score=35.43 Transcript_20484:633-1865(-)
MLVASALMLVASALGAPLSRHPAAQTLSVKDAPVATNMPPSGTSSESKKASAHCADCANPRIAMCVTGAARSFVDVPKVADSLRNAIAHWHVDVFFHVVLGKELSARGQTETDLFSQAHGLNASIARLGAGTNVVDVQVQLDENDFDCGQMSNGRFYKMGRCASAVAEYSKRTATSYSVFVLARPDIAYASSLDPAACLAPFAAAAPGAPLVWTPWKNVGRPESEVTVASFSGLSTFTDLAKRDKVKCCDEAKREPAECFIKGLKGAPPLTIRPHLAGQAPFPPRLIPVTPQSREATTFSTDTSASTCWTRPASLRRSASGTTTSCAQTEKVRMDLPCTASTGTMCRRYPGRKSALKALTTFSPTSSKERSLDHLLANIQQGEVAWFVSVWEVFEEQKWPLLPGGSYECK